MKYALALAGGGTRGAFEAGVWRALCELGIEISAIAGTSIGAVNGAMFASGKDAEALWKNIKAQDFIDIEGENMFSLLTIFSLAKKVRDGGVDTSAFRNFLETELDEAAVRASDIDFGLCTYRTDTKETVEIFTEDIPEGQLVDFVLASASFPLFRHTMIDGAEYSDGGLKNNLPVNMLIDRGYDTIITVSVKGPGVLKTIDKSGINIINIDTRTPEVGVMEFNPASIEESMKSGYYECMRVFGIYLGDIYPIIPESYMQARRAYGPNIISGIEEAADMCKINPYCEYTVSELARRVLHEYKSNTALRLMCAAMEKDMPGKGILDNLGKTYRAATAIVYLKSNPL